MVEVVPPSTVKLIALARLAVDLRPTPPASDNIDIDSEPSVTLVPWSLKIAIEPVVPPSLVMLTALARFAVLLMPTPPTSERIVTDSAPSVTLVPWSECIFTVSLVPALALK